MLSATICDGFELRPIEEHHAPTLFAVVEQEREQLRQWLPWVDATETANDTVTYIRSVLEQSADNRGFSCGIWKGDRLAGMLGMHRIDWLNRRVDIGYWLAREFQGLGVVTGACRVLIAYIFDELELNRVEIHCASDNAKSAAIPLRLGFKLDGSLREAHLIGGRYHDLLVYAILRREWKKRVTEERTGSAE